MLKTPEKEFLEKNLSMVRKSSNCAPVKVKLEWRKNENRKASICLIGLKEDQDGSDVLEDEPIDSPEYSISCSLPAWHNEEESKISRLPRLFHEVSTPEERRQQFSLLREKHKSAFR
jgi:hypothetical protein